MVGIVATHGHNDHINAADALSTAVGAPILLHPDDAELWAQVYPSRSWDQDLADGQELRAGGHELLVLHTPGHTPGGVCLHDAASAVVFSADTLFKGGPGCDRAGASPASRRSSRASAPSCSASRPTPSCTPATATTPASATRRPTSTSGSPGVTEVHNCLQNSSAQIVCGPWSPHDPRVVVPDAQQLKVLAHPLRSRLLGALRHAGPATATALAARLGTNSGATSYHLRQLAEVGLVEDDPEHSNGRDRWWRAAHGSTTWRSTDYDPDAEAAVSWLLRRQANLAASWVNDWLDEREQWPPEWQGVADQSDYHLHLTAGRAAGAGRRGARGHPSPP